MKWTFIGSTPPANPGSATPWIRRNQIYADDAGADPHVGLPPGGANADRQHSAEQAQPAQASDASAMAELKGKH